MASLVPSLFDIFSGNPTEKEQNEFGSLYGYQTGVGEGLITPAAQYQEELLSGDPTKQAQALAPEISAQQQQEQQFKNQTAEFAPRSGGTAASVANADTAGRSNIINLLGQQQGAAAGTSLSAGENLLGEASSNLGNEATLANQRRQQLNQDVGGIAEGAAQIIAPFLGDGGGGTDPYEALYNAQQPSGLSPQDDSWTETIQ